MDLSGQGPSTFQLLCVSSSSSLRPWHCCTAACNPRHDRVQCVESFQMYNVPIMVHNLHRRNMSSSMTGNSIWLSTVKDLLAILQTGNRIRLMKRIGVRVTCEKHKDETAFQ